MVDLGFLFIKNRLTKVINVLGLFQFIFHKQNADTCYTICILIVDAEHPSAEPSTDRVWATPRARLQPVSYVSYVRKVVKIKLASNLTLFFKFLIYEFIYDFIIFLGYTTISKQVKNKDFSDWLI